jgi:hypothetical protein
MTPERVEGTIEQCLAQRCDVLGPTPGHDAAFVRTSCRNGRTGGSLMRELCAEQCCAPEPFEPRGRCDLRGRKQNSCAKRAIEYCGQGGTSAFGVCRRVYEQYCANPVREPNVETCLKRRCDSLPADAAHTKAEMTKACRSGRFGRNDMRDLCAEQSCRPKPKIVVRGPCPGDGRIHCRAAAFKSCGASTSNSKVLLLLLLLLLFHF